jgi:hypothetical protein
MADLFLHLAFARRLRLAAGIHPLIGETLTRRPALVALGAALPLLPGVERKGMGFFMRLFSRGADAARWQKQLTATTAPRPELFKRFALPAGELGPMARLSLALGVLAHELLEASVTAPAPNGADRASVERAQARLWLQSAVPNARDLDHEWRPVSELADPELQRRAIDHVDAALKAAFGAGPGRDSVTRWMKGLVVEVAPASVNGLPPSLALTDQAARGPYYDTPGFAGQVTRATERFTMLAARLGARLEQGDLDAASAAEALCASGNAVLTSDDGAGDARERWQTWQRERRSSTLLRGRNDRPAFLEGVGEVKAIHRSNAFTGMLNLADVPPDALPPELQNPSLPPEATASAAPPTPAMTQEVSLAAIQAATTAGPGATAGMPPPPNSGETQPPAFAAPAMTQEISLSQIEAEARAYSAPTVTQEISVAQIEAVAAPPRSDGTLALMQGVTEQLQKLNELRLAGVITEAEFAEQKQRLLNITAPPAAEPPLE